SDLALHRAKLDRLTALFRLQTRRYEFLRRQYRLSTARLGARIVEAYESGNPDTIDVLVTSSSFTEFLDQLDYVDEIGAQDGRIVLAVRTAKTEARRVRERTRGTRLVVVAETRTVAARADQVRAVRDQLLASGHQLASARGSKRA